MKMAFPQALKSRLVAGILIVRSFSQISSWPIFYKALSLLSVRKCPPLIAANRDLGVGHGVGRNEVALWES
jgi:hypothetical protein